MSKSKNKGATKKEILFENKKEETEKEDDEEMEKDEEEKVEKLLQKKRNKNSREKEVLLCEINKEYEENEENLEKIKETKIFNTSEQLTEYLLTLKNPYTIINNKKIDLLAEEGQMEFYSNKKVKKIYENKEDNTTVYNHYKFYLSEYEKTKNKTIKIDYPISLTKLFLGSDFFLNIHCTNYPKLYEADDSDLYGLYSFFHHNSNNIYQLFTRKQSGTTLYIMKQMSRNNDCFIYFDIRKLKHIIFLKNKNQSKYHEILKEYIYYSLFNIQAPLYSLAQRFKDIEKYYDHIFSNIYDGIYSKNENDIIKVLFDAYIGLYKKYIYSILLTETRADSTQLLIIIDHYNYEIDYNYIYNTMNDKQNERLKILIQHSLNSKKKTEEFIEYLKYEKIDIISNSINGIAFKKNKTIFGYYNELYDFHIINFIQIKILRLYKKELIINFGNNNPYYFFRFIEYMEDKDTNKKDNKDFRNFINIVSNKIELDIQDYYDNDISQEYFFISKYFDIFIDKKEAFDSNKLDYIKNLPLDYFNIKFSNDKKIIIDDISPSFELVKNILFKISKKLPSLIFQSNYYDTYENYGDKGNILQRVIKEKIKYEPSILFNAIEKSDIFEIDYLIPSAKTINHKKYDPVEQYYRKIYGTKKYNVMEDDINIIKYMTPIEIEEMEILSKDLKKKDIRNLILLEKDPIDKNYDLAVIKFIKGNQFIIIPIQITNSRDKNKFGGINKKIEYDCLYLTHKFENYLSGYKSAGFHLIYILDKDDINDLKDDDLYNIENIQFRFGLKHEFEKNVHLIFFSRKYLNFYTEEGKIIKEISYEEDKLKFITSNIHHYFSDQKEIEVFNKVIDLFSIKVGKVYTDYYDGLDINGNIMIFTKLGDNLYNIIININRKKIHNLEVNDGKIKPNFTNIDYTNKLSYIFEIINPKEINKISLFSEIKY